MPNRYILIVPVPEQTQLLLRNTYKQVTDRALPIQHLHISILHPFFLKQDRTEEELYEALRRINIAPFTASYSSVGVYHQHDKKILHITLQPQDKFSQLHQKSLESIQDYIDFDKAPFTGGIIPTFDPHISLDYDWKGDALAFAHLQGNAFNIQSLDVKKEEDGNWNTTQSFQLVPQTNRTT